MQKYNKAIAGLLGGLIPFLAAVGLDLPDFFAKPETLTAISGVLASVLVYLVPNKDA